jgi:hypothetical protein
MTVRDLILLVGSYPVPTAAWFVAVPVAAFAIGLVHGKGRAVESPWRYVYSAIVYIACVPGIMAAVLTAYALFFTRENLLDVNLIVYFAPIVSMAVTLAVVSRTTEFDDIPGFDRLSGLMVVLAVTFIVLLLIQKTRIWVFFGASLLWLVIIGVVLFFILKAGSRRLLGDPRRPDYTRSIKRSLNKR